MLAGCLAAAGTSAPSTQAARHHGLVSGLAGDVDWVVFLRGMNLGGRRITNVELEAATEECGCRHVRSYQASGNLVVVDDRAEEDLTIALEEGLEVSLGYPVPVFLRSVVEVRSVAAATPFSETERRASAGKPQVIFLKSGLSDEARGRLQDLAPEGDRLVPSGREIHWLPAGGLADNALDLRPIGALSGGATVRTHGTVQRLASKFL